MLTCRVLKITTQLLRIYNANQMRQMLLYKESEGWIVGILNKSETKCHICKEYIGWSNVKIKKGDQA